LSTFSAGAYEKRFGSWRKALEAFISFINKPEQDGDVPVEEISGVGPSDVVQTSTRSSRHINWRTRFLVMRRDDFKCGYCGRSPSNNPGLELHVDHVKAWSKDGPTTMDNLRTACNVCNIGKSDLDAEELS
jgi:5-methylcytosine-specific restriction endonuclease McrA